MDLLKKRLNYDLSMSLRNNESIEILKSNNMKYSAEAMAPPRYTGIRPIK